MSGRIFNVRGVMLAMPPTLAGAVFQLFLLLAKGDLSWWASGAYMVLLGMFLGMAVGFSAMSWIPGWQNADGPVLVCGAAGVLVMVALWLYLPEATILILGRVAMVLVGAATGLVFGLGLALGASEPTVNERSGKPIATGNPPHE